ncbi:reverse transcriptase domain-containing protein [Tanacetum coccineum]
MPKDFLIEEPPEVNMKEVERKTNLKLEETKLSSEWKLYTDGASSFDGSGTRLMLIDPEGKEYTYALRFKFETTNNEAEYEALLLGLRITTPINSPERVEILGSSHRTLHQIDRSKASDHYLYRGLKITQSFSPITEHMEIMGRIKKQLARSQQGWVDNLSHVLWVHRTLPRNNQEETPFSLTYGSEAIIPTIESIVAKDGRGRTKEVTKRKERKEIASIEKAYY